MSTSLINLSIDSVKIKVHLFSVISNVPTRLWLIFFYNTILFLCKKKTNKRKIYIFKEPGLLRYIKIKKFLWKILFFCFLSNLTLGLRRLIQIYNASSHLYIHMDFLSRNSFKSFQKIEFAEIFQKIYELKSYFLR